MKPVVVVLDVALWFVQGAVMLLLVVPMQRFAQLLTWASWKVLRFVYYPVSKARRRMTGRPLWQDSDLQLGITPPKSEWERLGIVEITEEDLKEIS